ncbi:2-amino-4-hydroxy-6-hydroxymethyldihydropteridine diphosphokinase [Pelagicoccus sp. SDUM812002]|uniref:2-amino-4-hydroxy-6- hydroxymethyldihydropteridine diphosphokinase n=1 Tax=Pelagicoccus sp. SDUM812002 TaxID=3041266 RepID=UPI00280D54C5|nr:2-amino-4-hydroxy-6-hydroxymethyldihydropteridine diphosphokinase [Pelagicoccus sp. SDUM812002]MDQ8186464.1 2-amino-4-hydroxy-6-hydroxymethyldihydropteridine diphosphokinase [Pelagicoccus sp. SDUM812002]
MNRVYIGFGSNLGCKVGNIRRAVALLSKEDSIQHMELSSFYKTDPVGGVEQDWFVNAVARFDTTLAAEELLSLCLEVERELKRVRVERWGPRTLDIDILFYGLEKVTEKDLQIPHPRICERAFVLVPLLELDSTLKLEDRELSDCLVRVADQGIERMKPVVAILGASPKPERYAHLAQQLLMETGHELALVAPRGEEILGVSVIDKLGKCQEPVDTVTLYIGSSRVDSVLEDLLEARPRRVIFNPGTENDSVRSILEREGIETQEACTLVLLRTGQF